MRDKAKEQEYQKRYREKNIERIREKDRKLKRQNYQRYREQNRIWRQNNPEKVKEYATRYRASGAQKWYQIKHRYGIDEVQFKALLEKQQNKCPICGAGFEGRKPYIDHSHRNGKVRGLLHRECNALLGFAIEKVEVLQNAINYIKDYEDEETTIERSG